MSNEQILVVEDDPIARMDIQVALERCGFGIAGYATSGELAIEMADELGPDLVLMDIQLESEMDGVEAAGEIGRRFDIPVIYLTVAVDPDTLHWAKISGPFGYLLKPVDHNELRSAIEVGLYKHQMERELRKAKLAAEAANRAKSSFLATVSHELRTPMNGVLGMTELLLMSDLEEPYRENVHLIKESSMALLSVLNQIIDYSKLETSSLKIRKMDFRMEDLVSGVLSQYNRASKAKGVVLEYTLDENVPGWMRGDSAKLRQVLGNLVNNAVKFTPTGRIAVNVSMLEIGDGPLITSFENMQMVQITVSDSGVGIQTARINEIFESFNQAQDHLFHSTGGLGLGLAIVSRLVSALGGSVTCSSDEGNGSLFTVTVPLGQSKYEEMALTATQLTERSPIKGANILVVEDDLVSQRYIIRLLEKLGCTTGLADDGAKAVEALKEQRYDVVLMDVEMPNMNGIEATRAIRKRETGCLNPDVPIIALTAHAMWGDEQRCIHAGMDDYVSKPVEIETMTATIQSILEGR